MRRLLVACAGLALCLATPSTGQAARVPFECDACEAGGDEFCPYDHEDMQFCGAAATYCSDGPNKGWTIECIWTPDDECYDPCDAI